MGSDGFPCQMWHPKTYAKRKDFIETLGSQKKGGASSPRADTINNPSSLPTEMDISMDKDLGVSGDDVILNLMVWSAYVYKY